MIYFPYFRGRQFDLLALKNVAQQAILPTNIIPIIEPVRDIKALPQTIAAFLTHHHPIVVIANPTVSDYGLSSQKLYDWQGYREDKNLIVGHILTPTTVARDITATSAQQTLLLAQHADDLLAAHQAGWLHHPTYVLAPPEARLRQTIERPLVSLFDHTWVPEPDRSYVDLTDGFFSDDWRDATVYGYQGFSDYTIGGRHYSEHGYPARAVTLHLTYVQGPQLRIHRFVSTDREDFKHPKEKFFQAVALLATWLPQQAPINQTPAARQLASYHVTGHFPGLGVVKRLSLEHHLQVTARLFSQLLPATD